MIGKKDFAVVGVWTTPGQPKRKKEHDVLVNLDGGGREMTKYIC